MSILYELKNIEYFFDEKRVLSIDNLILEENKIIGFFGPNGSGKSTLFSILSFISKPQNGEIIIDENNGVKMIFMYSKSFNFINEYIAILQYIK